jgi:hypothetical protein
MDDLMFKTTIDPALKVETPIGQDFVTSLKWQGRLAVAVSLIVFTILSIIRFAFKILEQRYYLFCSAGALSILLYGLSLIVFDRIVRFHKSVYFYKIYYGLVFFYLVIFFSVGFATFGCIRCIYGLIGSAFTIPVIILVITLVKFIIKFKRREKLTAYKKVKLFTPVKIMKEEDVFVIDSKEEENTIDMDVYSIENKN